MAFKKLVGHVNRHESWTSEVILERDEESGEVTKSVLLGVPTEDLSDEDVTTLEERGFVFEDSSAEEAEEVKASVPEGAPVGGDVAAAAPTFGSRRGPNQARNDNSGVDQPRSD